MDCYLQNHLASRSCIREQLAGCCISDAPNAPLHRAPCNYVGTYDKLNALRNGGLVYLSFITEHLAPRRVSVRGGFIRS